MLIARMDNNDEDAVISLVTGNEDKSHQSSRGESEQLDKLNELIAKWDAKTYGDDYSKNPRKKLARELWSELNSLFD